MQWERDAARARLRGQNAVARGDLGSLHGSRRKGQNHAYLPLRPGQILGEGLRVAEYRG